MAPFSSLAAAASAPLWSTKRGGIEEGKKPSSGDERANRRQREVSSPPPPHLSPSPASTEPDKFPATQKQQIDSLLDPLSLSRAGAQQRARRPSSPPPPHHATAVAAPYFFCFSSSTSSNARGVLQPGRVALCGSDVAGASLKSFFPSRLSSRTLARVALMTI